MISHRIHIGSLALLLICLAYCIPAHATTRHVPTPTYPTIAAGLAAAVPGDDVLVDCGTYNENGLVIPSGVWLHSQTGQSSCVTIDAQSIGRVLSGSSLAPSTKIEGITLTDGSIPTGEGAGFLCNGGSPTFINCLFTENIIASGGGGGAASFMNSSAPTFTGCTFDDNHAEEGGAVYLFQTPGASFTDCVFSLNSNLGLQSEDSRGGGIYCFRGSGLTLTRCLFYGNGAAFQLTGAGGAIFIDDTPSATLSNCTLVDNHSFSGSAMQVGFFFSTHADVTNTIIAFNRRFSGNPGTGPVECGTGSDAVLTCCDVFGNQWGFGTADWVGCLAGQLGIRGNLSDDPLFCDDSSRNYRLVNNSPCAPAHSPPGCGLIGALPVGCLTAVEPATWGRIKSQYQSNK